MSMILKVFLERIEEISKFVIIFFIELCNFIIVGLSSSLRGVFTIGEVILISFKPSIFVENMTFPMELEAICAPNAFMDWLSGIYIFKPSIFTNISMHIFFQSIIGRFCGNHNRVFQCLRIEHDNPTTFFSLNYWESLIEE